MTKVHVIDTYIVYPPLVWVFVRQTPTWARPLVSHKKPTNPNILF